MDKKIISSLVMFIAAVIFVNLLVFIIPFSRGTIFWIAYAFLMLALVAHLGMNCFIQKKLVVNNGISKYPLLRLGYIYLIIQVVVSVVFFFTDSALSPDLFWIPLALCIGIFGVFCGLFATSYSGLKTVQNIQETEVVQTAFVKNLTIELDILQKREANPDMQKKLFRLYELVRYSDPVSSPALSEIEQRILENVQTLKSTLSGGDVVQAEKIVNELSLLMDERNQRCKLMK